MGRRRSAPPPRPSARFGGAPPPARSQQQSGGSLVGGLAGMIYQGFGWGVGSSLGRAATASILGGSGGGGGYATETAPSAESRAAVNPCEAAAKAFGQCVSENADDLQRCQTLADAFQSCKRTETMR